jgi:hypothetical protein
MTGDSQRMNVERIFDYYAAGATAARKPYDIGATYAPGFRVRVPDAALKARAGFHCAHCHEPIEKALTPTVVDISTYHPSCAILVRARARKATTAPPSPPVIAIISGRACPIEQWCTHFGSDGSSTPERFSLDAFDGVDASRVELQVNHNGCKLPGTLTLQPWRDGLDFRFELRESPYSRGTLAWMQAGECVGCSVGFNQSRSTRTWDHAHRGEIITACALSEISILRRGRRPSWYGTYASVRAV